MTEIKEIYENEFVFLQKIENLQYMNNVEMKFTNDRYSMLTSVDKLIIEKLKNNLTAEPENNAYAYNFINKIFYRISLIEKPYSLNFRDYSLDDGEKIKSGYRSKHIKDYEDIILLEYYTFFHNKFGIFKNAKRNYSNAFPLVSLNFNLLGQNLDSHGRSSTLKTSTLLSVIEGLERIHGVVCFFQPDQKASENNLINSNQNYIGFDSFVFEKSSDYPFESYDKSTPINWVNCKSVKKDENILIPEQIIYYNNNLEETRYIESTSNGVAIGSNNVEATISSILELIERDSFLVHWYTETSPQRILGIEEIDNEVIQNIIELMKFNDYKLHFFNITTEIEMPTVWILFEYIGNDSALNIKFYNAASTDISIESALESALVEGSSSIKALESYLQFGDLNVKTHQRDIETIEDHILYYSTEKNSHIFNFAKNTDRFIFYKELEDKLNYYEKFSDQNILLDKIINRLSEFHSGIYFVNLSSEFLNKLSLSAIKVIIPSMQNIHFGYHNKNINKKRLKSFLNNKYSEIGGLKINENIHPFP